MKSIRHWTVRYVYSRAMQLSYQRRNPDKPWLTKQSIQILSTLLKPEDTGLEFGSGSSTIWFAGRIKHLTSVEHDHSWYEKISRKLKDKNIRNVDYYFFPLPEEGESAQDTYLRKIGEFDDYSLDFVLVDGRLRDLCACMVLEKIRPGGVLVLDNAERYLKRHSGNVRPASKEWTFCGKCAGMAPHLDGKRRMVYRNMDQTLENMGLC